MEEDGSLDSYMESRMTGETGFGPFESDEDVEPIDFDPFDEDRS